MWYDKSSWSCGIAVIRLDSKFESPGAFPIANERNSPLSSAEDPRRKLFIVGYPSDMPHYDETSGHHGSDGAIMYQSKAYFDFNSITDNLEYQADTFGGMISSCPPTQTSPQVSELTSLLT